jgi:glucosamine--fructose-6-phosphate aminotransferase (isomerizing)
MRDHMFLEMTETPAVVGKLLGNRANLSRGVDLFLDSLNNKDILFTGCGSSYFAGISGAYICSKLLKRASTPISAFDYSHYRFAGTGKDTVLFSFSQSGETSETIEATKKAKEKQAMVFAITNNSSSRLASLCDWAIEILAGTEKGPGTKTVVAQLLAIYLFFLDAAKRHKGSVVESLYAGNEELKQAEYLSSQVIEIGRRKDDIAELLYGKDSVFIVGTGPYSATAFQAANVLKEAAKIHAEGFETAEFRHGPLELVSDRSAIILLNHYETNGVKLFSGKEISKQTGCTVIDVVMAEHLLKSKGSCCYVVLPEMSEVLGSILSISLFHEWSYKLAKRKGLNPNEFRNIVKTWTH